MRFASVILGHAMVVVFGLIAGPAHADSRLADAASEGIVGRLRGVGGAADLEATLVDEHAVSYYIGGIIQGALALVGVIFVAQMVYAGYLWMTARGESDQVDKAKDTIQRSTIGIAIVLTAWIVTNFVVGQLLTASSP